MRGWRQKRHLRMGLFEKFQNGQRLRERRRVRRLPVDQRRNRAQGIDAQKSFAAMLARIDVDETLLRFDAFQRERDTHPVSRRGAPIGKEFEAGFVTHLYSSPALMRRLSRKFMTVSTSET